LQFTITHDFDLPLDVLERAVLSPDLARMLEAKVPSFESVTARKHEVTAGRVERVTAFQANVSLPSFARGIVTKDMCAWEEHSTYDTAARKARWFIRANVKPEWQKYFKASGDYVLEAQGATRSRRRVHGDLELAIPVMLRMVGERLIYGEVQKTFEGEAASLLELAKQQQAQGK
jgi:hypothetical protein